ncbi:MAG: SocA family protein [Candidatus Nealsonbacteria bacterium]|nr:MAG: SocA family protein [Candidatus Nealsonbacteria bacterium]
MNRKKYKVILHYIIKECGSKPNFGKTVLWKLLYFADFDFYELYEKHLIGEKYKNIKYGPAPVRFNKIIGELKSEKKVKEVKEKIGRYDKKRYIALEEPNLEVLSGNEKELLDNMIKRYGSYNASQIEEVSHKDIPVRATGRGELIEYELVFYREPPFSIRSYEKKE